MAETNPHRILKRLNQNLAHPVELTLFGRAALALGFGEALAEWGQTLDVDLIVASHPAARLEPDNPFWEALEATNAQLAPSGLYLAHIFEEHQVILRPGWYAQKQRIEWPELGKLTLYRPATLDLILTKMARADDPEDRRDLLTLIGLERLSPQAIRQAMADARVPDGPLAGRSSRRVNRPATPSRTAARQVKVSFPSTRYLLSAATCKKSFGPRWAAPLSIHAAGVAPPRQSLVQADALAPRGDAYGRSTARAVVGLGP